MKKSFVLLTVLFVSISSHAMTAKTSSDLPPAVSSLSVDLESAPSFAVVSKDVTTGEKCLVDTNIYDVSSRRLGIGNFRDVKMAQEKLGGMPICAPHVNAEAAHMVTGAYLRGQEPKLAFLPILWAGIQYYAACTGTDATRPMVKRELSRQTEKLTENRSSAVALKAFYAFETLATYTVCLPVTGINHALYYVIFQ